MGGTLSKYHPCSENGQLRLSGRKGSNIGPQLVALRFELVGYGCPSLKRIGQLATKGDMKKKGCLLISDNTLII